MTNGDDDEGVEGPATPPPDMWGNRGLEGPRPTDPWMEMEAVVGDLWEAGQEFTVYMLIRHLDLVLEGDPTDRVAILAETDSPGESPPRLGGLRGWMISFSVVENEEREKHK